MKIENTKLSGCYIIQRPITCDERGYFSRVADIKILTDYGINANFVNINVSKNAYKGTLRGLHSQKEPWAEDKLITCARGEVYDVAVDVNPNSPTFGQYVGEFLSESNGKALYVPKGCAHGYITLTDDAQVLYFVTQFYNKDAEVGYNFADPKFAIDWPTAPVSMSEKDKSWKFL